MIDNFKFWVQKNIPCVIDDSLSYYECLEKLVYKLNEVIEQINNLETINEDVLKKFEELKSYVENYFNDLDVQKEINTKLDLMVSDGTLDELIRPYLSSSIKNNIRKLRQPLYYAPYWRYTRDIGVMKSDVDLYKSVGFDGFQICIHFKNDWSTDQRIELIDEICEYIIDNNLVIPYIKFHEVKPFTSVSEVNVYLTKILEIMDTLKKYTRKIYIFNEDTSIANYENEGINIVNTLKENGYNVNLAINQTCLALYSETFLESFDGIGLNWYPHISSNGKNTSLVDVMENTNFFSPTSAPLRYLLSKFGKEKICITETGVLDYWVYLTEPATYSSSIESDKSNGEVAKLYFNGIFENWNNAVESINIWFPCVFEKNIDFFKYWLGIF